MDDRWRARPRSAQLPDRRYRRGREQARADAVRPRQPVAHPGRVRGSACCSSGVLRTLTHAGLDRVVPDIAEHRDEVGVVLHGATHKAILEEVPYPPVLAIEPARVSDPEPLQDKANRLVGGTQHKVDVVRHQAVREHATAARVPDGAQGIQESLEVLVLQEHSVPVHPTQNHVVHPGLGPLPRSSWHDAPLPHAHPWQQSADGVCGVSRLWKSWRERSTCGQAGREGEPSPYRPEPSPYRPTAVHSDRAGAWGSGQSFRPRRSRRWWSSGSAPR